MKICFIAPANSIHTVKMCKWFASQGHTIDVISFEKDIHANPYATIHTIPVRLDPKTANNLSKLQYLIHGKMLRTPTSSTYIMQAVTVRLPLWPELENMSFPFGDRIFFRSRIIVFSIGN